MLDYVYGHDKTVAQFVSDMLPDEQGRFGKCKAIGVVNGKGHLIAGVVYHDWRPNAGVISISAAALPGSHWLTRETIRHMYEYPFERVGLQMVMHFVAADNERLLRILAAAGMMFVRLPRVLGRDRDGVLCLFTRETWDQCRFNRRSVIKQKEAA